MADEQQIETPQPNEAEIEARNLGWVGKDEFKGDPANWRSAEEFLDRGKRILPIVLKDNERLQRNLNRVKDDLAELRNTTKELVEFNSKAEQRAYDRARQEIEDRMTQAAANADTAGVRTEMKNLDDLAKEHAPKPKKTETEQPKSTVDPEIQDWIDKEPWFNKDRALNAYAIDIFGDLERNKPGMSTSERLAETKRKTMDKFPEKFGINPERERASAVAEPNGGGAPRNKNAKSYDNLPAEAKRACDKFVKTIPGYKREDYVRDYDWDA